MQRLLAASIQGPRRDLTWPPRAVRCRNIAAILKRRMLTLFHHPFCPHSRFVRLALQEVPLPAAQDFRTFVQELFGAAHVVAKEVALRQAQALVPAAICLVLLLFFTWQRQWWIVAGLLFLLIAVPATARYDTPVFIGEYSSTCCI